MPDIVELQEYYESLSDAELLRLANEKGFTGSAELALANELKRRNLSKSDLKRYEVPEHIRLREEAEEKGSSGRGFGLIYFGRQYMNETDRNADIQIRTKFFAVGGIPLIPIASYRFKCTTHGKNWFTSYTDQKVVSHVPLVWSQVFRVWIKTVLGGLVIFLGAIAFFAGLDWYRAHFK